MKEIKRVKNFDSGEVKCECGCVFDLYYNGGELDYHKCKCGLVYQTESFRYDLVVYKTGDK